MNRRLNADLIDAAIDRHERREKEGEEESNIVEDSEEKV